MAERSFTVRLSARVDSYVNAIKQAERQTHNFSRTTQRNMGHIGRQMESFGRMTTVAVTVPLIGMGAAAIKSGIDWESAFTGVRKTVDGTASQMANLESELRSMTSSMPASHKEIAAVAEAAGQLGIKVDNIADFTEVMVKLGDTTNVIGQEGAINMARFMNVMQTAPSRINELGATLVHLGNNTATTEAEILELSTRIAGAGKIAGLSESDVMALSAAITSVGVKAEAGGTATSKFLLMMRDATLEGGEALQMLANVSGISMEQFTTLFERDAAQAFTIFIEGLRRASDAGNAVTPIFEALGVADERLMRAMRDTANAGPLLAEALDLANEAASEGTALNDEAAKRYETVAARLGILRNKAVDLGIDMAEIMLPAFEGAMSALSGMIDVFDGLPTAMQVGVLAIGALAAAIGPTIWIMGSLIRNIQTLTAVMHATKWASLTTPLGILAATAATAAGVYLVLSNRTDKLSDSMRENAAAASAMAETLRSFDDPTDKLRADLIALADTTPLFVDALTAAGVSIEDLVTMANTDGVASGMLSHDIRRFARDAGASREEADALGAELGHLVSTWMKGSRILGEVNEVTDDSIEITDEYAEVTEEAEDATDKYAEAVDALIERLEAERDALQESVDALNDKLDASRAAADASFALRDAEDDFAESLVDLNEVLADGESSLREVMQAQDAVAESARDVADSHVRIAEENAAMNGEILTATERLDIFNESLLTQAAAADGPAREAIIGYIAQLNGIPEETAAYILTLIDEGKVEEAETALAFTSRDRRVAVSADADQASLDRTESALDRVTRDRTISVGIQAHGAGLNIVRWLDKGGMGYPGDIVAEHGPELVDGKLVMTPTMLTRPARVTGREETARLLSGTHDGPMAHLSDGKALTPMPQTVYVPAPSRPDPEAGNQTGVHIEHYHDESGHAIEDVFRVADAHLRMMGV